MRTLVVLGLLISFSDNAWSEEGRAYLEKMRNSYGDLSLYQGGGKGVVSFVRADQSVRETNFIFDIEYKRDRFFYFIWMAGADTKSLGRKFSAVWQDQTGAYEYYSSTGLAEVTSICKALSGAVGVSYSIAGLVPLYLTFEKQCHSGFRPVNAKASRLDDGTVIVSIALKRGAREKLYLDGESYLLKKYESYDELPGGTKVNQVIDFNIDDYR